MLIPLALWLASRLRKLVALLENYGRMRFVLIRHADGTTHTALRLSERDGDSLRYVRDAGGWALSAERKGRKLVATNFDGCTVTLVPTSYSRWLADNEPYVPQWLKDRLTGEKP